MFNLNIRHYIIIVRGLYMNLFPTHTMAMSMFLKGNLKSLYVQMIVFISSNDYINLNGSRVIHAKGLFAWQP